jgi:hypothetical protein
VTARPLDEILPQRAAIRWICLRRWSFPRLRRASESIWRAWQIAQPWIAALAFVLLYGAIAAWLEAEDARVRDAEARVEIERLERENFRLKATIAEYVAITGKRSLFYIIEGQSVADVTDKLQRLAMTIAGEAFDMQGPPRAKEPRK